MAYISNKRTMSVTSPTAIPNPRPAKAPRITEKANRDSSISGSTTRNSSSTLHRTHSLSTLALPTVPSLAFPTSMPDSLPGIPPRKVPRYKDQRERRTALVPPPVVRSRTESGIIVRLPTARTAVLNLPIPPIPSLPPRSSSPLAPTCTLRTPRPFFPRSRTAPDWRRRAITACMRASPAGRKALLVGPRLAERIQAATLELERIVAAQQEADRTREQQKENMMQYEPSGAPVLSNSWVVVPGEDWEMVDCSG